jgi:hypothetical protein
MHVNRAVIASSGGTAAYASDIGKTKYIIAGDAIANCMSVKTSGHLKAILP